MMPDVYVYPTSPFWGFSVGAGGYLIFDFTSLHFTSLQLLDHSFFFGGRGGDILDVFTTLLLGEKSQMWFVYGPYQ